MTPAFLDPGDGRRIAYRHVAPADPARPTLVFLPGYASDMAGGKAQAVAAFAAATGAGSLSFDYSGCGVSAGAFVDGTLARWLDEVLALIDRVAAGRLVLVGSSMGGWLALHVALRRAERVAALVGIAAAPDFTDWGVTAEQKLTLLREGELRRGPPLDPAPANGADPSLMTRAFWQSGEALRLLHAPIAISCPVRLLHGDADEAVPVGVPLRLLGQLASGDAQLTLLKGGDHRLSEPPAIDALLRLLAPLIEPA